MKGIHCLHIFIGCNCVHIIHVNSLLLTRYCLGLSPWCSVCAAAVQRFWGSKQTGAQFADNQLISFWRSRSIMGLKSVALLAYKYFVAATVRLKITSPSEVLSFLQLSELTIPGADHCRYAVWLCINGTSFWKFKPGTWQANRFCMLVIVLVTLLLFVMVYIIVCLVCIYIWFRFGLFLT